MCCLQEVKCRGQGSVMLGLEGRRCKLWWFGKGDGVGGVGVIVMEELCKNVVQVRKVSDAVIAVVLVLKSMC